MPATVCNLFARLLAPLMSVFLCTACIGLETLQTELPKIKGELNFLHDSPINACAKKDTVYLDLQTEKVQDYTHVKKKYQFFIPLIFFNHSTVKVDVSLGKTSLKVPLDYFYGNAFQVEAKRNACFAVVPQKSAGKNAYRLQVKIDSVTVNAPYFRKKNYIYIFFGVLSLISEEGRAANTHLYATISLFKGDELIAMRRMSSHKQLLYLQSNGINFDERREDFMNNMTESFGLALKETMEAAVLLVNTELH